MSLPFQQGSVYSGWPKVCHSNGSCAGSLDVAWLTFMQKVRPYIYGRTICKCLPYTEIVVQEDFAPKYDFWRDLRGV